MSRNKENWAKVIEGKTPYAIARFVTSDLTGYRSTSLSRADDETSLAYLIEALLEKGTP